MRYEIKYTSKHGGVRQVTVEAATRPLAISAVRLYATYVGVTEPIKIERVKETLSTLVVLRDGSTYKRDDRRGGSVNIGVAGTVKT